MEKCRISSRFQYLFSACFLQCIKAEKTLNKFPLKLPNFYSKAVELWNTQTLEL